MKAILMSIRPKWIAKILNGEKTIEVRKTAPKCDLPIDVYIYCTKDNHQLVKPKDYNKHLLFTKGAVANSHEHTLNGKVVAKFTLNKVEEIKQGQTQGETMFDWYEGLRTETVDMFELLKLSCLIEDELKEYLDYLTKKAYYGYAWYIDNLVIFDKPKELSEFETTKQQLVDIGQEQPILQNIRLTKAPQSWCYVEELL